MQQPIRVSLGTFLGFSLLVWTYSLSTSYHDGSTVSRMLERGAEQGKRKEGEEMGEDASCSSSEGEPCEEDEVYLGFVVILQKPPSQITLVSLASPLRTVGWPVRLKITRGL